MEKKITKATVKSFIRKNRNALYINVKSSFSGITDGCEPQNDGFKRAETDSHECNNAYTLGINGLWLVGESRDRFHPYEDEKYIGFDYYNCCGHGILAIRK